MGGTDEPSNLMEVSVEEHAELHFALYLNHGHWQDYIAALGLVGIIGHEDVRRKVISEANKGKVPWNKGKKTGPCPAVAEANRKRKWSEESKAKLIGGKKNKGRKRPDLSKYNQERGCVSNRDPETGRFTK